VGGYSDSQEAMILLYQQYHVAGETKVGGRPSGPVQLHPLIRCWNITVNLSKKVCTPPTIVDRMFTVSDPIVMMIPTQSVLPVPAAPVAVAPSKLRMRAEEVVLIYLATYLVERTSERSCRLKLNVRRK
jgi:hypothetical protein